MTIHDDILGTVDDAWLVRLSSLAGADAATVVAAVAAPGTSAPTADALARRAIDDLEAAGPLDPAATLVACGATFGAGVAMIAAARGLACVVVVDDTVEREARNRITALGADLRVLPLRGTQEDLAEATQRVAIDVAGAVLVEKRRSSGAGEAALAERWLAALGDTLHAVVGTERDAALLAGLRAALQRSGREARVMTMAFDGVAWADPSAGGVLLVSEREALATARRVARASGLLCDAPRGGAALAAAAIVARESGPGRTVLALVPAADTGDLLTAYDAAWWTAHHGGDAESLTASAILRLKDDATELVTLRTDATVAEAIRLMRDLEVSQIPVVRGDRIVGTIREDQVIDLLLHANERKDGPVEEIMEDALPEIDSDASVDDLQALLVRGGSAVIVRRSDGRRDILTKYDLIHALTRA